MKKIIGIIAIVISLAFITILILRIWDIEIVSLPNLVRSTATLVILGISSVVLIILYGAFFRKEIHHYDVKSGNRAHPKS